MKYRLFALSVLVILALSMSPSQVHAQSVGQRAAIIPIKIILIGLDGVDINYLTWSASSSGNLPTQIPNSVLTTGNNTGEVFYPQYTVVKASSGFKQSLVGYLNSIQKSVSGSNPWFHQYNQDKQNADYCTADTLSVNYVVYDANSVEDWLWTHNQDLGGFTPNGWTIVVSYLPELPSLTIKDYKAFKSTNGKTLPTSNPHYYGISRVDSDLGYRPRYRDFMDAWGGRKAECGLWI